MDNDSDSDGILNEGSVTIDMNPANGTITNINPVTGAITYEHDGSATNSDSFTYTVEDNEGAVSNAATVDVTVTEEPVEAFVSDDFCGETINTNLWTINEVPGGTISLDGAGTSNVRVRFDLQGGAPHEMHNTISAPHLLQQANDVDFHCRG